MTISKLEQLEQSRLHHKDVNHLSKMTDTERLRSLRGDVPNIARTMISKQIIGRGLRLPEGKDKVIILDHSDTHEGLGAVDKIHHDELCDGGANI